MAPPRIFEAADSSDLDERSLVNFSWFQVPIKLYVSFVSGSLFFEFVDDVYDCYRPGSFTVEKTSEKYLTAKKILLFIIYLCILIRVILDFVQNYSVKTNVENIGALSRLSSSTTTGIDLFVSK